MRSIITEEENRVLEQYFDYIKDDYLETWTNGGVDMIIYIDEEDKSIIDTLKRYINNFDIDEEIDLYRQDKRYREAFTITESVDDFRNWINYINNCIDDLKKEKEEIC